MLACLATSWPSLGEEVSYLEEYQGYLEQELADVADRLKVLRQQA